MKTPLSCKAWWCVRGCTDFLITNNFARHQKLKAVGTLYNTYENAVYSSLKTTRTGTVFMFSG